MTNAKNKVQPTLRTPKPKKLNLRVPDPLRLPHEDLIRRDVTATEERDETSRADANLATQSPGYSVARSNAENSPENSPQPPLFQQVTVKKPGSSKKNLATQQPGYSNQVIQSPGYSVARSATTEQPGHPVTRSLSNQAHGYFTAHILDDDIAPRLSLAEQSVIRRLYRLSYGFHRQITDCISVNKLAEKCNLSVAGVKLALKSLQDKGLVRIVADKNKFSPTGGNKYEVLPDLATELLGYSVTWLPSSPINHDHDQKYNDHDQMRARARDDDDDQNLKRIKKTYAEITGNAWKATDARAYDKVKHVAPEVAEAAMRAVMQRSSQKPASFAYFVAEILKPTQTTSEEKKWLRDKIKRIVDYVRERLVGGNVGFAEFAEEVKLECARRSVDYDPAILNDVLGL
jgi:DNA-binding GntR family transcriptional regulator